MTEHPTANAANRLNPYRAPLCLGNESRCKIVGLIPLAFWLFGATIFWSVELVFDRFYIEFELPLPAPTAFLVEYPVSILIMMAGLGFCLVTNSLKTRTLQLAGNLISLAAFSLFVAFCAMSFVMPLIPIVSSLSADGGVS